MSSLGETSIKVVHLAQSDSEGGANRAANRLHNALRLIGVNSIFHCGRKLGNQPDVVAATPPLVGRALSSVAAYLNARTLKAYPNNFPGSFSPVQLSYGRIDHDLVMQADVVCVHWIAGAFLKPSALTRIARPLIWRLSDLWPFTGGCHYPADCRRFELECGACPILGSTQDADLSRAGFSARERAYRELDLTIVAPSRWIAEHARRSRLFGNRPIEHIPTGIDLNAFAPQERVQARSAFELPLDRKIILFGALASTEDPRKGFNHLRTALETIAGTDEADNVLLVVFGGDTQPPSGDLPLPTRYIGRVNGETRLAALYSAADVFVAPFLEDNLPNVVLEALACGTPVVAFGAGGIPEAVEHRVNGYVAPIRDAEELAKGVLWVLSDPEQNRQMSKSARAAAEERFDILKCARRYQEVFMAATKGTQERVRIW